MRGSASRVKRDETAEERGQKTHGNESVIQEILHPVLGFGEHLGEDLSEGGNGREVVFLLRGDLPKGRVQSVGVERVGGERIVWV